MKPTRILPANPRAFVLFATANRSFQAPARAMRLRE
jgi:hypothetical protein